MSQAHDTHTPVMTTFSAAMRKLEAGDGIPIQSRTDAYSALLMGLEKPDSASGIRPVAMGELFSRQGHHTPPSDRERFNTFFSERHQLGVAVQSGTEAIVHGERTTVQDEPEHAVLQLDFFNALNTVPRAPIRTMLSHHFPELLPDFMMRAIAAIHA